MKKHQMVAIVGRPNVGKSALFNRIVGKARAIVDEHAGLTRDRNYDLAYWLGREFFLVDTGGFELNTTENMLAQMRMQTEIAIDEADVIIMVVDGRTVIDHADRELAARLRKSGKHVILAVNKIDNEELEAETHNFWNVGFGEPIGISALQGRCVDELLDAVIEHMPVNETEENEDDLLIKMAIVGMPNAGKSSLVNCILGEERVVVNDTPGTTRDSVSSFFNYQGKTFQIMDTAGVRAKRKINFEIERYAVMRALRSIEETHVAVMLLDATKPITEQDEHIAGYIHESGRACILAINKWDLVEKESNTADQYMKTLKKVMPFMDYAPVITISAKTGQRVNKLLDLVTYVNEQHLMRIKTSLLNKTLQDIIQHQPPPTKKGKVLKIKYVSQTGVRPPAFALFVNDPGRMQLHYLRHMKNEFRKHFGLEGTPVIIMLRGTGKEKKT